MMELTIVGISFFGLLGRKVIVDIFFTGDRK